jgi:SAM-dependent methyltransferase
MTTSTENAPQYFGKDLEAMSFALNYHRWIMDELAPFLGESVAEVGAGTGNFSKLILDTGVGRLTAFEPSENMYPMLAEFLGPHANASAVNGFFARPDDGERFSSVCYVNVLEHIEDDAAELRIAHDALEAGGHLLIFVPALPRLYSELDRQVGHFRRYVKKGLEATVAGAGFNIVKSRYFDIAGILPWYVNFVLLGNSIGSGSVSLYDRLVIPPMRRIERLIKPPIGKNLLLVARKD